MSSSTNPSQIHDIQYSMDANFKEMRSKVDLIDTVNERAEEKLRLLKNRLDQAENAAIGLDKLEDDIEKRFASLSSSISNYQEWMDGATQKWQDDFENRVNEKLQSIESILAGILSALPIPEGNYSHRIPVLILPLLSPHASPSPCSIRTQYESIGTQCEIIEAVKSITTAHPLKQQEDHKTSHNRGKLQIDNLSSGNTTVRPSEELQQKQACMYVVQGKVEDII
ncbi:hypothetical protein V8E53_014371 [Lactarius tabidus]